MQISELQPVEAVHLDTERLEEIFQQMGYAGGETEICAAMEDLAVLLQRAGKLWKTGELDTLQRVTREVSAIAGRIGMAGLARVSGDVAGLCWSNDGAALAATVARMRRLGERSLLAIWDRQDLTI